jgi:GNAT superfamily N-acetyltransferase
VSMTMAATTTASASASASVVAHAATAADLPFIAGLFAASNERDELGIGYPRCDDAGELLAELALYNASLEDSFHVLRLADGQRVGALGFLFDDDMPFAYVAGPLLDGGARHRLDDALACAERIARGRYPALRNSVADGNREMIAALGRRGWSRQDESLEMVFELDQLPPSRPSSPSSPPGAPIERLAGRDAPAFAAAARLLGRTHHWDDPEGRLAEYLDQGYRVAFVRAPGRDELAGAAAWLHLEQTCFSRLDYVSTHEDWRGRGIGAALVDHALADARRTGDERMYLALDPANAAAHRLYLRAGFRDNLRSIVYTLERLG